LRVGRRRWPVKCPECGAEVGDQMVFCTGCGRQVKAAPHPSGYLGPAHASVGHKTKEEKSALLLVVLVVVLMVLLPLALVLILYIGILGFGAPEVQPVTTTLTYVPTTGGFKFTLGSLSTETEWDDFTIVLSDGSGSVSWTPYSSGLDGQSPAVLEFAPIALGDLTLFCNVTDLDGNGQADPGDYFTLTTGSIDHFSTEVSYTVLLVHEPTESLSASTSFPQ